MLTRKAITTVLILLLCMQADAWRRRRRRRCATHSCSWRWGTCSRTCGGGNQSAIKTASQGACGSCNMPSGTRACNTHCCRSDCQWYSWGNWGSCSRNCGGGTQTRSRGQRAASCGGTRCIGPSTQSRSCNSQCCPVHCSWGGWSSWRSCSKICGRGTQSRSRSFSPAPSCGGRSCSGSRTQTQNCNTQCCPVHCSWASWSGWSSCSKICGGGSQTRTRGHSTTASCGGRSCPGASRDSRECNKHCCPQHCSWASWSNWAQCSVSCGGGSQQRSRAHAVNAACGGSPCPGNNQDSRTCNTNCCPVNCMWDTWTSWASCSATCGGGNQGRHRVVSIAAFCGGQDCVGRLSELRDCNAQCCPVDCVWRSWHEWGRCSVSCGGGVQARSRSFDVTSSCGGQECDGVATDERTCNDMCCPVDCSWASWSRWGECSVSCGGGVQSRSRGEDVAKYCGGNACDGDPAQTRQCNSECCPVACVWGDWSQWDSCSVSCGGGHQQRSRSIAMSSECEGAECVGSPTETQTCNSQCCPVDCKWNDWSQWGACSKSCEKGSQRRTRTVAVESQCNGKQCPGNPYDDRFCNDVCCPVHCRWDNWSEWTGCTKTCGSGTQTRQRGIQVETVCAGEECIGENTVSRSCNDHCCPVDCELTSWTEWSECSHSCGAQGERLRNRRVTQPSSCGGTPCSNNLSERELCNQICFNGGAADENLCQCPSGWAGECCADDVDECNTVDCPRNSKCMNTLGSYDCTCDHGYTKSGDICQDIDECQLELHNCHVEASCINRNGHYTCRCNPGFTGNGTYCEDVNECGNNYYDNDNETDYEYWEKFANTSVGPICHDDADCINTHGSYRCECIKGFSGDGEYCEDIDECSTLPSDGGSEITQDAIHICDKNAICQNVPGSYHCLCKDGFSGEGSTCKEVDECVSEPCQNEGQCADFVGGFKCLCTNAFQGELCQYDVDECVFVAKNAHTSDITNQHKKSHAISRNISCSEHSTCTNTFGSFDCTCNRGYTGDGYLCSDVDECALMETPGADSGERILPCHAHATCTNVVGNYDCKCNRGFAGSGFECEEIDECASTPCKHSGTCINQLSTFTCICPSGYRGQSCEIDINECIDGTHECDPEHGRCMNLNGAHQCICKDGFSGNGKQCTDIDECESGLHDCNATENNECRNSMGSYLCHCIAGYEKADGKCSDVDECEIGNHVCTGLYEECKNTKGGYRCDCRAPAVKTNGTCKEPQSAMMQDNGNTWTKVANTLQQPSILAIVVAAGVLMIASVVLIIKIRARRSTGSYAVSSNNGTPYSQRRSSILTENMTL